MQHAWLLPHPTRAALALLPNCFQTPEAEPRGILSIKILFFIILHVKSIKPFTMNRNIYTLLIFCLIHQFTIAQDISLEGTIWLDSDSNNQYDGEVGISNVKVYLINVDSNEILDSTSTNSADFNFPSTSSITIPPGTYYLEIAAEEFTIGGDLQNITSCSGSNNANDGVDFDDNGLDIIPIQTTNFSLDSGLVDHVDICLSAPCDEANDLAIESCDGINEADIICDIAILGTFCNMMPSSASGGPQPNPLCPEGGVIENVSWFAFMAFDGNYSLIVSPSACMGSTTILDGIQVGIYTDCTFTESVFCHPTCSEDPITISSNLLVPGQIYYFFIDGCGGSVCSYSISIGGNPLPFGIVPDDLCILDNGTPICEDSEFITGEEIVFQVDNLDLILDYSWQILYLSGGPFEGDPLPMTEESNIELTFNNEGVYEVCLTSAFFPCSQFDWSGQLCRMVTIKNLVGLQELERSDIKITPNPTFDYITIDGNISFSEATFFIYSIDGERVMSGDLDSSQKINVMDLPVGLYVISVIDGGGEIDLVGRFVKSE